MREEPDLDPQYNLPHGDDGHFRRHSGGADISDAVRGALVGYEVSMERLHSAVIGYAAELKAGGATPEQMVPQIRKLLQAIPRWARPANAETLPADMTVVDRAVQWAIEAYYEQPQEKDDSRSA